MVYMDASRPDLVEGVIKKTCIVLIAGVPEPAIQARMIEPERFDAGIRALYRTAEPGGIFCDTCLKASRARAHC